MSGGVILTEINFENIKRRRGASDGLWLHLLLPLSIIISALKHPIVLTPTYKLASLLCAGLVLTSLVIFVQNSKNRRLKAVNPRVLSAAVVVTLLCNFYFDKNWTFSIFTGLFSTIIYLHVYLFILQKFEECFTLGEAGIVSQAIVIILYCTILNLLNYFENVRNFETNLQISTIIIQVGLTGIAGLAWIFYKLNVTKPKTAYIVAGLTITFGIFSPLHILLKQSPLMWISEQLFKDVTTIKLVIYWSICVVFAILSVSKQIFYAQKASTGTRKIFHILTVVIFIPGLFYRCSLLYLASGVIAGIFFALEIIRILKIPPLGTYLQDGFVVFADEKDTGTLALTAIYLLVGASIPIWIHPSPCDVTDSAMFNILPLLSGILSIGIGDTAASVVGSNYGKFHWAKSKKTVEGTVACILSQIGLVQGLLYLGYLQSFTKPQLIKTYISIFITSIIEAKTTQVDNLVLPLVMYIMLI